MMSADRNDSRGATESDIDANNNARHADHTVGRVCAIFNPKAGRGRLAKHLRRLTVGPAWEGVEFWPTEREGHALLLAERAASEGFLAAIAVGGDGTVHEVANGLLRKSDANTALLVLPLGSANDFAWSFGQQFGEAALSDCADGPIAALRSARPIDAGWVKADNKPTRRFMCNIGAGLNGRVTLEAKRIRWLRGLPLYGAAALKTLFQLNEFPNWTVSFDDQPAKDSKASLMLCALNGRRDGTFRFAPEALLDDGKLDYVYALQMPRRRILPRLPRLAFSGPPNNDPKILKGQASKIVVQSDRPLCIHSDGELFCVPDDQVCQIEIGVSPRIVRVAVLNVR